MQDIPHGVIEPDLRCYKLPRIRPLGLVVIPGVVVSSRRDFVLFVPQHTSLFLPHVGILTDPDIHKIVPIKVHAI